MKRTWQVDDATAVDASFGTFGRGTVSVNGVEVHNGRRLLGKYDIAFELHDGRSAKLSFNPLSIGKPAAQLRVEGRLLSETRAQPFHCAKCASIVESFDRYCDRCGHVLPNAEQRVQAQHVQEATNAIKVLAVLFAFTAAVDFAISRAKAGVALSDLEGLDAGADYPVPHGGIKYTVGALRDHLLWEQWSALVINLILVAVMTGLAIWGKRAPLPAVLVATATYAVVNVANAIRDPATIAQGLLLKLVIVLFLAKGIKAGLALRATHA
jgi:hypothetical protein